MFDTLFPKLENILYIKIRPTGFIMSMLIQGYDEFNNNCFDFSTTTSYPKIIDL